MFAKITPSYYKQLEFMVIIISIALVLGNENSNNKQNEDLFKRLFKLRRAEQLEAVKKMRNLQEDKQLKMVKSVTKTIFEVISKGKVILENSGYIPGVSDFPERESIRDALSLVLENTALMSEMVLRLPSVADAVLHSTHDWLQLMAWSLIFANETQLLDNTTTTLIQLVSQELNLTTRSPDYINPYRRPKDNTKVEREKDQVRKKKKKTEIPRGPRLTLPQVGEL